MTKDTPPRPGVLAKIGDEEITQDQLIGDEKASFFELQKREYELRMARIERLLVEKLVGGEAKKAGMSLDDYLNKKVLSGDVKITDAEYNAFVKEKHIPESQINAQLKDRIHQFLKEQKKEQLTNAYVAKLTKSKPVELYFQKPRMQVQVEVGDSPTTGGGEKAPVTIVVFSDFQCPFCARGADVVNQIKKKYGSKVRIAFRHFPLPMHKEAVPASEAAMCVYDQNKEKFWKFHDIAFKNQDKLDEANLLKHAKDAGADEKKFKECVASKKYAEHVQKDLAYGETLGVKSTPSFYVNGQPVSGALPLETFSEMIDEELEVAKK